MKSQLIAYACGCRAYANRNDCAYGESRPCLFTRVYVQLLTLEKLPEMIPQSGRVCQDGHLQSAVSSISWLVHVFADCFIAWWVVVEKQKRITNPFIAS